MGRFQIVGDSDASTTLASTSVIPVVPGVTTGTGDATAIMTTLADLSTFFLTIDGPFTTTTATATPSAYTATTFTGFASTVSGAVIMGYGTTFDATLKNRAGTDVIGVTANTTGVVLAGALAMTGALSGVTTLVMSGALSGLTTVAMAGALSGVTTLAASGVVSLTDATDSTSATTGSVKLTGGMGVAKALFVGTSIRSVSPTAGIGYATGAGGAQTQATSKSTTVVSNTITTAITMNAELLVTATTVAFTFTNSSIAATDTLVCSHESAGTSTGYVVNAFPGAGSAVVSVRNITVGNLSEAIVIRITVVKSVSA